MSPNGSPIPSGAARNPRPVKPTSLSPALLGAGLRDQTKNEGQQRNPDEVVTHQTDFDSGVDAIIGG